MTIKRVQIFCYLEFCIRQLLIHKILVKISNLEQAKIAKKSSAYHTRLLSPCRQENIVFPTKAACSAPSSTWLRLTLLPTAKRKTIGRVPNCRPQGLQIPPPHPGRRLFSRQIGWFLWRWCVCLPPRSLGVFVHPPRLGTTTGRRRKRRTPTVVYSSCFTNYKQILTSLDFMCDFNFLVPTPPRLAEAHDTKKEEKPLPIWLKQGN